MKQSKWLSLIAALAVTLGSAGAASASGADLIKGSGARNEVEFDFHVVINRYGNVIGWFDSTLISNIGLPFRGAVDCGRTSGNIGVFGGLIEGADPTSASSWFTVIVSDRPDGIIIGNGRPNCGTEGFGSPQSLAITEGQIVVRDR